MVLIWVSMSLPEFPVFFAPNFCLCPPGLALGQLAGSGARALTAQVNLPNKRLESLVLA